MSKRINVREYRGGQSKNDIPEKQDEKKKNNNTTQYVLETIHVDKHN